MEDPIYIRDKSTNIYAIDDLHGSLSLSTSIGSSNGFCCVKTLVTPSIISLELSSISLSHRIAIPEISLCSVELSPPMHVIKAFEERFGKHTFDWYNIACHHWKLAWQLCVPSHHLRSGLRYWSVRWKAQGIVQATFTWRLNFSAVVTNNQFLR